MSAPAPEFLSPAWLAAAADAVARIVFEAGELPDGFRLSVGQRVTGAPGGTVEFRVVGTEAGLRLEPDAAGVDVLFESTFDVAVAIATGERSAGQAVLFGDVTVHGDGGHLLAAAPALERFQRAMQSVTAGADATASGGAAGAGESAGKTAASGSGGAAS